ncbi:hypothetical protein [Streptomyces sp. SID3343]|uniref:hypothetical protein n=1 Tax=Streptomyces sp. SID3343 TaxID=2690260 RepID=UPI00136F0662|nr:hypothetical protein [Streptomyces sp. SID3343]MYW04788.1 hypothetical protein [Streptomyces sp. SID3343]
MTDPLPGVVVVAAETDLTADLVVSRLGGHAAVVRLDPGRMREQLAVTGAFAAGRWRGTLRHLGRAVTLDQGCSVYWRKPTRPENHADRDERWRAHENTTALLGLLKAHPLRAWVNDPTVVATARHRATQLAAAARVGLTVPDTLFTSDPATARAFVADHHDRVVVKTLTQRHTSFVPTTRLRLADDLAGIAGTVHYLQALVADRWFDARVTVVDHRAFAAAITTHDELDWRAAPDTQRRIEPVDLPADVERACVAHVRDLELSYAALDFVVTTDGWTYLETNCAGEYGFVEALTGLPITDAITRLLLHGPVRSGGTAPSESARM